MELTIDDLKKHVLQNSDYLFWTGNIANINQDNKITEMKKLRNLDSQSFKGFFEFIYSKNITTERIFLELKINPFKIQSGKFLITDFNSLSYFYDNLSKKSLEELEELKVIWKYNNQPNQLINLGKVDELVNPNLSTYYGVNEFTSNNFTTKLTQLMYEKYGDEYLIKGERHYENKISKINKKPITPKQQKKLENLSNELEDFKLNITMYKNSKDCLEEFAKNLETYNN